MLLPDPTRQQQWQQASCFTQHGLPRSHASNCQRHTRHRVPWAAEQAPRVTHCHTKEEDDDGPLNCKGTTLYPRVNTHTQSQSRLESLVSRAASSKCAPPEMWLSAAPYYPDDCTLYSIQLHTGMLGVQCRQRSCEKDTHPCALHAPDDVQRPHTTTPACNPACCVCVSPEGWGCSPLMVALQQGDAWTRTQRNMLVLLTWLQVLPPTTLFPDSLHAPCVSIAASCNTMLHSPQT